MRLRFKLIAATLFFTFVLTVALSLVFLSEIFRERVEQTDAANSVAVHQILAITRTALQSRLRDHAPITPGEDAFHEAVVQALQNDGPLADTLNGVARYSPSVQDAYLADARGQVIVSTDPSMENAPQPHRRDFSVVRSASLMEKRALLFGTPEVLDASLPLDRNGHPFLTAHVGIRSTLLRNAYAPWLWNAAVVCILALVVALLLAAAISAAAMRPLEQISRELDVLSGVQELPQSRNDQDAVERVTSSISRLDERIRSSEQTRTEMATNLNSMLQTLKDGVMLIGADMRIIMSSDAVRNFLPEGVTSAAGVSLSEVFPEDTDIGAVLTDLVAMRRNVRGKAVTLSDGRTVEISIEFFSGSALLTLHDVAAQEELEREIEVSRRMASIARLTSGVGHEVKNPINAMVVHLELLRGKLSSANTDGAQRHVEVLASEMGRLDRVVQTLADFSRPMEPVLKEQDLQVIVQSVAQLVTEEAQQAGVSLSVTDESQGTPMRVVADGELLRQALLNIVLNAMQAMPAGGVISIHCARERGSAVLSVRDTGIGIPADRLGKIFDLYFTTKSSGSGIGLAMTYRIVQMHGGVIQVSSNTDPGSVTRGTTFTIRLPLAGRNGTTPAGKVAAA